MTEKIRVGLSIVLLSKNEAAVVNRCLISLLGWADEIIVVDDCSVDNTVDLCKQSGCRVFVRALNNDFSNQRNFGTQQAKGRWIFHLAPDEVLPDITKAEISRVINSNQKFSAYNLKRLNYFLDKPLRYCGALSWDLRLFEKDKGFFEDKVHEHLNVKGDIGFIEAEILHFAFDHVAEVISAGNFYTDIESEQFVNENKQISMRTIKYQLTIKSLKRFWKLYVKKQGYKDGMHGFIWCILNVIGPQMRWMKIWEKAKDSGKLIEK